MLEMCLMLVTADEEAHINWSLQTDSEEEEEEEGKEEEVRAVKGSFLFSPSLKSRRTKT